MAGMDPGTTKEYWENCLAEYELALQEEFNMEPGKGFNDDIIQLLKFEINECLKQLA
tara:strand:+ start:686 stop:856 length:171 start_codon:yes stop_codon:yes gene_type:complete